MLSLTRFFVGTPPTGFEVLEYVFCLALAFKFIATVLDFLWLPFSMFRRD